MKVKCIERFNDITQPMEKIRRMPGDIFEVSKERGEYLIAAGVAEAVTDLEKTTEKK